MINTLAGQTSMPDRCAPRLSIGGTMVVERSSLTVAE